MSKSSLLLIQPPVHLQTNEMGAKQVSPNIGLAYIAAFQRARGISVTIIDAHAERLDLPIIIQRAKKIDPDLIGISAMTYQITAAAQVAAALKETLPQIPIVVGGCHATAEPIKTIEQFPAFDAAIAGEGENAISDLLSGSNGGLGEGPGIYLRRTVSAAFPAARPFIEDLDALPFPAFDLFPLRSYWPFYSQRWRMEIPLSASRGCPFHCSFCTKVMGNRTRFRSPESLVTELEHHWTSHRMEQVIFTDENFTFKPSLVEGFCRGVIAKSMAGKIRLICQSRVQLEEEMLALMAQAGFTHITYGIESGDQTILDQACKSITPEQSKRAVVAAKRQGMIVDGNFILGLPGETEETIRRTVDLACSLPLDYASFFLLVPYPGSQVMEMARRGEANLRLLSENWDDFGKQIGGAVELINVSRKRLEQIQFHAYLRFYSHPRRWLLIFRKVTLGTVLSFFKMRLSRLWEKVPHTL